MNKFLILSFFPIFILLASCSSGPILPPSSLAEKKIDFLVLKTLNTQSRVHKKTLRYKFRNNNSYRTTVNDQTAREGNYSYYVKNHNTARLICTHSINNQLSSYEVILTFVNPQSGTWASSYNNKSIGAESGTFVIAGEK